MGKQCPPWLEMPTAVMLQLACRSPTALTLPREAQALFPASPQ